jgi:predicted nucleotide-binding protein
MKLSVARTIEKLGLNPIILHEQPSKGKTIIEKFTDNSDVTFAIVLLSADDIAYNKNEKPEAAKFRARQNVIFELGYFIGKLGRDRVLALHEQQSDFEIPSDYSGVLFVPFDRAGKWQFDLVKELKALMINVDANNIL